MSGEYAGLFTWMAEALYSVSRRMLEEGMHNLAVLNAEYLGPALHKEPPI